MTSNVPGVAWTPEDLHHLDGLRELEIAAARAGGEAGPWTPVWVVVADGGLFVRTWRRRKTGWYGRAVAAGHARIRVSGESADVLVAVTGGVDAAAVDAAYRTKYGDAGAQSILTAEAAASTLRLDRAS